MVIDGLDGGAGEEAGCLAGVHADEEVGEAGAEGVEEEAFEGVVIEGAVGVGDVEAVVTGVECC